MNYNFEWDSRKAGLNFRKHKISFEDAATVFKDPRSISLYDSEHSSDDERWITLGIGGNGALIVVVHTFEEQDEHNCKIRIISARKATKKETKQYKINT